MRKASERRGATIERSTWAATMLLAVLLPGLLLVPLSLDAQEEASVRAGVSGFISTTLFAQDRRFAPGDGQQAQRIGDGLDEPEGWWHGGDVRNSRFAVDLEGTGLLGRWTPGGLLEFDLFGGVTSGSGFDQEQLIPRMRLAYIELSTAGTSIRVGQDWAPIYLHIPESVSHVAFPLGYGSAGLIGWRFPGIFIDRTIVHTGEITVTVRGAAMRGGWEDDDDPPNSGQSSMVPQLELRLDLERKSPDGASWEIFLAGHVDRKEIDFDPDQRLDGWAVTASGRIEVEPLTLQGGGYTGRAVGQHAAHISQFGDIGGWGGWAQAGFQLTPQWSGWLYFGLDDPNNDEIAPGGAIRNQVGNVMLRYRVGVLDLGAEWLFARTEWREDPVNDVITSRTRSGQQIALGALLSF